MDEEVAESVKGAEITSDLSYLTYANVVKDQSETAKEYHAITLRLELFSTVFELVVLILLVFLGFPNYLRDLSPFGASYSFLTVLFVISIFVLTDFVISLPLSYYKETIERDFEFATRTSSGWIKDKIKELLLSLVLFALLIEALFTALFYQSDIWWILAFGGYFVFAGLLSSLSPYLISIFTKIEPMEEGEVRTTVEEVATQMDLQYDNIYLWKMSQQTTKANAAVVGFGKTIRIMIGDTLANHFRPDEIQIVMAHEIAHQQNRDMYRSIAFSGFISLIAFFVIDLGFETAMDLFDLNAKGDPASIGYIFLAMSLIMLLLGKLNLWYTRRREKAADLVAIKEIGNIEVFESAFARLSKQNLSFPNPSKLEVLWRYSHPPIRDRIAYGKAYHDNLK